MATERFEVIIPTATNLLNRASQNIADNLRRRQDSSVEYLSLYKLAKLVNQNSEEILISRVDEEQDEEEGEGAI